jgi:hypothetical protein
MNVPGFETLPRTTRVAKQVDYLWYYVYDATAQARARARIYDDIIIEGSKHDIINLLYIANLYYMLHVPGYEYRLNPVRSM